jgi:hypothetical protein
MAVVTPQSNTISMPYFDVPFLPFEENDQTSRKGASFFSNVKQLQVGFGSSVFRVDRDGMWAGAEEFADAPWSVDWDGNMIANSVTISGYIPNGGALADIGVGNITGTYISDGAIVTAKLAANSVVASKISVASLSAISANIGTVTAGTITGVTITGGVVQTSASTTVERARMLNSRFEVLNDDNTVSGYLRGYKDDLSGFGRSELETNYVSILSYPASSNYCNIYYASGAGGGWKFDINDGSDDVIEFFGVPVAQEIGIGSVFTGYGSLTNNGGDLEWNGDPVGFGNGTVTSIATTSPILGGTITGTGTISHASTAGNKHIPTGGATHQYLKYSASGTATWEYLSGESCGSLIPSASSVSLGNSTFYWDNLYVETIFFHARTGTPSTAGQFFYYSSGGTQQFRANAGGFQGSVDLTAI